MKFYLSLIYLIILRVLAQIQLLKNKPIIVGITGSAGKTSSVQAVSLALSAKYKVKNTNKGNSETGIPLSILGLPIKPYQGKDWIILILKSLWQLVTYWPQYDILVAELGIDSDQTPKNMSWHLKLFRPKVGVLLNASNSHTQYFKNNPTVEGVIKEKGLLLKALQKDGLAILNHDQPQLKILEKDIKSPIKYFSVSDSTANLYLRDYKVDLKGTHFKFLIDQKEYSLYLKEQILFRESFGSFASALLVAQYLKVDLKKAISKLEQKFIIPAGRGRIFEGIKETTIIDSSYNSSPQPTIASLNLLSDLANNSCRKIAVLGDMRELGTHAKEEHQNVAQSAIKNADLIVTVGPLTTEFFPKNGKIHKFLDSYSALNFIKDEVQKDDLILVKGSQNTILTEIIVEGLLKNNADKKKLCRREKYWHQERLKIKQLS